MELCADSGCILFSPEDLDQAAPKAPSQVFSLEMPQSWCQGPGEALLPLLLHVAEPSF